MASDFQYRTGKRVLLNGGIIGYKTDTLYGLGCDPFNLSAVTHLNRIKNRGSGKHFIIIASRFEFIAPLVDASVYPEKSVISNTEVPTSWVLPAGTALPDWLQTSNHTVAVRISHDPVTTKLCSMLGSALISTSANRPGHRPASSIVQLRKTMGSFIDLILASSHYATGKPSTIRRLCDNTVIRP